MEQIYQDSSRKTRVGVPFMRETPGAQVWCGPR